MKYLFAALFLFSLIFLPSPVKAQENRCPSNSAGLCNTTQPKRECVPNTNTCEFKVYTCQEFGSVKCWIYTRNETSCSLAASDSNTQSCSRPQNGNNVNNASDVQNTIGTVETPEAVKAFGFGAEGLNRLIANVIRLVFTVSAILVVFMILFGAFQWITSGGDKEAVGKARQRITYAIIGIVLLSLTFVILRVLGQILNITFFTR